VSGSGGTRTRLLASAVSDSSCRMLASMPAVVSVRGRKQGACPVGLLENFASGDTGGTRYRDGITVRERRAGRAAGRSRTRSWLPGRRRRRSLVQDRPAQRLGRGSLTQRARFGSTSRIAGESTGSGGGSGACSGRLLGGRKKEQVKCPTRSLYFTDLWAGYPASVTTCPSHLFPFPAEGTAPQGGHPGREVGLHQGQLARRGLLSLRLLDREGVLLLPRAEDRLDVEPEDRRRRPRRGGLALVAARAGDPPESVR